MLRGTNPNAPRRRTQIQSPFGYREYFVERSRFLCVRFGACSANDGRWLGLNVDGVKYIAIIPSVTLNETKKYKRNCISVAVRNRRNSEHQKCKRRKVSYRITDGFISDKRPLVLVRQFRVERNVRIA